MTSARLVSPMRQRHARLALVITIAAAALATVLLVQSSHVSGDSRQWRISVGMAAAGLVLVAVVQSVRSPKGVSGAALRATVLVLAGFAAVRLSTAASSDWTHDVLLETGTTLAWVAAIDVTLGYMLARARANEFRELTYFDEVAAMVAMAAELEFMEFLMLRIGTDMQLGSMRTPNRFLTRWWALIGTLGKVPQLVEEHGPELKQRADTMKPFLIVALEAVDAAVRNRLTDGEFNYVMWSLIAKSDPEMHDPPLSEEQMTEVAKNSSELVVARRPIYVRPLPRLFQGWTWRRDPLKCVELLDRYAERYGDLLTPHAILVSEGDDRE